MFVFSLLYLSPWVLLPNLCNKLTNIIEQQQFINIKLNSVVKINNQGNNIGGVQLGIFSSIIHVQFIIKLPIFYYYTKDIIIIMFFHF